MPEKRPSKLKKNAFLKPSKHVYFIFFVAFQDILEYLSSIEGLFSKKKKKKN